MLLTTLEAPLLGATCALLVDSRGDVVVVDPGFGVAAEVLAVVAERGWVPRAVLATHGHVDHTWEAGVLCNRWGVPLHIHEADAYRIGDPFGTLGPLGEQLRLMAGSPEPEPPALVSHAQAPGTWSAWDVGLADPLRTLALPGHTQGSTAFLADVDGVASLLTGDVLFAGTIGRTDLPGGDATAMAHTLSVLAALDPETVVIPGHGPRSTIGAELRTNPYLRAAR